MRSYCTQCGRTLLLGNTVCPACGHPTGPDVDQNAALPPRGAATWGFWPVALGILALIPAALLAGSLAQLISLAPATVIAATLLALAQLALIWLLALRAWPPPLASIGLARPHIPLWRVLAASFIAFGANLGFAYLYERAATALGWNFLTPPPLPSNLLLPGEWVIFSVIALAVATPIAEEVFFRGFVLRGLSHSWGFVPALVVSSALFAALHLQPGVIIPVFVTALLLGALYRYAGSVLPCIAVHATQNLLAISTVMFGL